MRFLSILSVFSIFTYNQLFAQSPTVNIATPNGKDEFCANQTITLAAQASVANDEIISWRWEGDMSIVANNFGEILILKPQKEGVYTFTVYLKDITGNETSTTKTIKVNRVFKPTLKISNGVINISLNGTCNGCNFSYFINNQRVSESDFKEASLKGKYYVVTTTPEGCSASSNILEVK